LRRFDADACNANLNPVGSAKLLSSPKKGVGRSKTQRLIRKRDRIPLKTPTVRNRMSRVKKGSDYVGT